MKTKYTVALAMAASFGLGVLAVQSLHAQAKPPGYVVVEVAVTDKDGYTKEFIPPAAKAIEEGGRQIRGARRKDHILSGHATCVASSCALIREHG